MLINEMMEECIMMDRRTIPDGQGGWNNVWSEGAEFMAAVVKDNSLSARVAEKEGITDVYTVTVDEGINLSFNDVFKRAKDGAIFKVTSEIVDTNAPKRSTIKIGQVSAKRWELD